MKAVVKYGKGKGMVKLREVPDPKITKDDEVLIEVKAVSVCGSDLHIYHDAHPYWPPMILGHEFSGVIVDVGKSVKDWKVGDRVVSETRIGSCGVCYVCQSGFPQVCEQKRPYGIGVNGAYAKYVVGPARLLHSLPENVTFEVGAIVEPTAICITSILERSNLQAGETVLIIGPGPIGLISVAIVKVSGSSLIILIGRSQKGGLRLQMAQELGADLIIDTDQEDPISKVHQATKGLGVDSVDLQAATDLGIIVANVPDYCVEEVANHTVALILTLSRKTAFFDRKVKSNQWDFRLGIPIYRMKGRILGLIGCGRIGMEVAKKMSSFEVKVVVFDPYLKKTEEWIELKNLDGVLKESDMISIHCPLNESTRHLIGEKEFRKMEKRPFLINTSRGAIIDEKALIQALKEGLISGAGLDVLEKEPPDPTNPLLMMENVILTPHMSFYSVESISELKRRTAENVSSVLQGKWPRSVVNPQVKGRTRATILE